MSASILDVKFNETSTRFPLDGVEAGQRERHGIGAGRKVDDRGTVRCRRSTTVRTFSISAGLAASTVTPGSTAPDVSRTDPAMEPSDWAIPDDWDEQRRERHDRTGCRGVVITHFSIQVSSPFAGLL